MAKRIVQSPKPDDTQEQIENLRAKIENIDALSQEGFSQISAIAKLALAALEHPYGYLHHENIAKALQAIWNKAENVEDCIGREAEEVGCNYEDQAMKRRYAASYAQRQAAKVAA